MYKRCLNEWKGWVRRLAGTDDNNEALARGAAVGFFFGVSIFWGLQIVLAVLGAQLIRGNKVVAAAMTAVSNPLTTVPLYAGCYWVGQRFSGGAADMPDLSNLQTLEALLSVGREFLLTMFFGSSIVGLAGALLIYLLAERIVPLLRKRTRDGARYPSVQSWPCGLEFRVCVTSEWLLCCKTPVAAVPRSRMLGALKRDALY